MVKSLFFYDFRITKREKILPGKNHHFFAEKIFRLLENYTELHTSASIATVPYVTASSDGLRPEAEGRINDEQTKPSVPGNTKPSSFRPKQGSQNEFSLGEHTVFCPLKM